MEAVIRVVGYFFEPDVRAAIARNQQRSGRAVVPVKGILGTRKRLQEPQPAEGFDDLYRVTIDPEGEFAIVAW